MPGKHKTTDKLIGAWFDQKEAGGIKARADALGLTVSDYIRELVKIDADSLEQEAPPPNQKAKKPKK